MKIVLLLIHTLLLWNIQPNNPVYWDELTAEERETVLSLKQDVLGVLTNHFERIGTKHF